MLRTSDGSSLYVREIGKGPRVVILHGGWGKEHSYMVNGFRSLADSFRLVFYDQRGSLRSPCDSGITLDRHVRDLDELRRALGDSSMMLVGHSMGGYLAMEYAARYPERVRGLALLASAPAEGSIADMTSGLVESTLKRWSRSEVVAELRRNGITEEIQRALDHTLQSSGAKSAPTPQQRAIWHRITQGAINLYDATKWRRIDGALYYAPRAAQQAAESMPATWDHTAALAKLSIPILVLHGDDDFLPIELHRRWVKRVPNARLEAVANAGHLIWIDEPKALSGTLARYLKERVKSGGGK